MSYATKVLEPEYCCGGVKPISFQKLKDEILRLSHKNKQSEDAKSLVEQNSMYTLRNISLDDDDDYYHNVDVSNVICTNGNFWNALLKFDKYLSNHAIVQQRYLQNLYGMTLGNPYRSFQVDRSSKIADIMNLTDSDLHIALYYLARFAVDIPFEECLQITEITTQLR
uniref:Uncharacterized protein n=1 Tax=Pithovirus LCPAC404 TaxID=2506597 RepID=A0A481ZGZ1_9VIRU|nr:MAG: hypothetical protein LCPAC404_02450 [Pithovirus LCPAC404]